MGSPSINIPQAPPAPTPVDPGQSSIDYIRAIASPELQNQILAAEQAYSPQYINQQLQNYQQMLYGSGNGQPVFGEGQAIAYYNSLDQGSKDALRSEAERTGRPLGEWLVSHLQTQAAAGDPWSIASIQRFSQQPSGGLLGLYDTATRRLSQIEQEAQSAQRAADIADVQGMGRAAAQAFRSANPELMAAMSRAEGMGGASNFYQQYQQGIQNQPQFGNITFNPATAPTAAAQGYQAANAAPVAPIRAGSYQGAQVSGAPQVQGTSYQAANAAPVQSVQAGSVGQGALGGLLYDQAINAGDVGAQAALRERATALAGSTGELTADEMRQLQQDVRAGYAARGTIDSGQAITGEALARLTNQRERMLQDVGLAAALQQQDVQAREANRAFQQNVQGADVGRQQQNLLQGLQADLSNQNVSAQQAALNQAAQNQAAQYGATSGYNAQLANQAAAIQQALANQQSTNQANQFNVASQLQGLLANQGVSAQQSLANQQAQNQAGQFGAASRNQANLANAQMAGQFGLANQSANLATQEANRNFGAAQYQQGLQNQFALGQALQGQSAQDRSYALNLAQMQQGIASDPFMAILGRQGQALGAGVGAGQFSTGLGANIGPSLFDTSAGVNLALQNNANLANYNASIYGSQAAAAGAQAQAQGGLLGGLFGGLGTALGGPLGGAIGGSIFGGG